MIQSNHLLVILVGLLLAFEKEVTQADTDSFVLTPKTNKSIDIDMEWKQNEIQDDRIKVSEPYKSLIQITARQVLTQANITRLMSVDEAMEILADAGLELSKPTVLIKTINAGVALLTFVMGASVIFPKILIWLGKIWEDPIGALDPEKYFPNGISERSIISSLVNNTDALLNRISLRRQACRKQALCYSGEFIKLRIPRPVEGIIKFVANHSQAFTTNKYLHAFNIGFDTQDCTSINSEAKDQGCLVEFLKNFILHFHELSLDVSRFWKAKLEEKRNKLT